MAARCISRERGAALREAYPVLVLQLTTTLITGLLMVLRNILLVTATASLGLAAPAAACDQHGPGQMGGFHRYNPFASALNNLGTRDDTRKDPAIVRRDKSEKAKKEDKRRQNALEEQAKSEGETERAADIRERSRQRPTLK